MGYVLNVVSYLIEKAFTVKNAGRNKRLIAEKPENFAGNLKFARSAAKTSLWVMKGYAQNV